MQSVQFPNVSESFDRALQDVLSSFFTNAEGVRLVGDVALNFPVVSLSFSAKQLYAASNDPCVVFTGDDEVNAREEKVNDPEGKHGFAYEHRANITRTVYVKQNYDKSNPQKTIRGARRIWDCLFAVFATQNPALAQRGIFLPHLESQAKQIPSDDYVVLYGQLRCQVRAKYTRANEFDTSDFIASGKSADEWNDMTIEEWQAQLSAKNA